MLGGFVVAFLVITGFTWLILSLTWPNVRVIIHVRWKPDVTDPQRVERAVSNWPTANTRRGGPGGTGS